MGRKDYKLKLDIKQAKIILSTLEKVGDTDVIKKFRKLYLKRHNKHVKELIKQVGKE